MVWLHHVVMLFRHGTALIFICPIKNHIFVSFFLHFFTPFHPVIETSAFALISRPEAAEGVNQCSITRAKRVKGVQLLQHGAVGWGVLVSSTYQKAGESM